MRTIVVDDEPMNLEAFSMEAENLPEVEITGSFQSSRKALEFAKTEHVDLAVLDIEMPGINGIALGNMLREINPNTMLIYVTGFKQYAYEAFQAEACGYILKPYDCKDIQKAVRRASVLGSRQKEKRVVIQTFGKFEVFVDGQPAVFTSAKAKELLALLVDHNGAMVTTEEILTYLWEDKADTDSNRSLCRKVLQRLRENLASQGISDIVIFQKRGRSIDKSKVECDYFQYLDGDPEAVHAFRGEYMTNYSWPEETLARLLRYKGRMWLNTDAKI